MIRKKKWLLTVMAIALVLGLVVTGCGSTSTPGSNQGAATQVKEMKTSYCVQAEPKTLDPQLEDGIPEAIINTNLFEGLTRLDKNGNPVPGIAEKWDISPDMLTYTFHLRDSVFSNGDPLTADDFKFAWLHGLDPDAASTYAYQLYYIKGAEAYNNKKGSADDVAIKVVDPKTLQVTLTAPTPYFLSLGAFPTYFPVDSKLVKANKDWNLKAETFVSNGPFMMKEWDHKDKIITVKNPKYWDAQNVKLSELTFSLIDDAKAALTSFEAGQLDGLDTPPVQDMDRLQAAGTLKIAPYLGTYYYRFNTTKKPFNDPRVRQAFTLAIDRAKLIKEVIKGGQTPAFGFVPGGIPDATPGKTFREVGGDFFKEDLAKAKQLLADAGYPDGKGFPEVSILYNTNQNHQLIAQAIQDMWKTNLGVNVKLTNQEWKVYLKSQEDLQYDVSRAGWIGDYDDPMTFMDMFVTKGDQNQTGWSNKDYDADIQKAKTTGDQAVRMQAMHDAEKILMAELPIMPIYYYTLPYVSKDYVKGMIRSPLGPIDFKYVTTEK